MAGLLTVFAACSNDDTTSFVGQDGVPVTLSYQTLQADTRAAAGLTLNDGNIESGKAVTVRISRHGADSYSNYTYTAGAAGALSLPSPAPYYPLDNTNIDILAFFPSNAGTSFTVQSDQTTDDAYLASDLMWATKLDNVAKTTSPRTLQFAHKMAKIVVNVTAGTQISQINSVTLKQVMPTVNFDQGTGAVTLDGTASTTDVEVVSGNTSATVSGAAVIPAQTIAGALLEIGVTKSDATTGTATNTVDSKTFSANGVYTLNITVSWPEVGATTAITGWSESGTVNIHSSGGSPFMSFTINGWTFKMIYVEGTDDDVSMNWDDQTSGASYVRHPIKVSGITSYYIGQTEVTNGLWYAVMNSKPNVWSKSGTNDGQPSNADNRPVAYVSWEDICSANTGFIDKLNEAAAEAGVLPSGWQFVLPSEVQWQFAAIGGLYSNGYIYSGSSTFGDSSWNGGNSGSTTHDVATKPANELGIYDMSGNVWEWCRDQYATVVDNQVLAKDYVGTSGSSRVVRGGSWYDTSANAAYLYPSFRYPYAATIRNCNVGFRVALQFNP